MNNIENQDVNQSENLPKKPGRKSFASLGKEYAPDITKSKRIPIELLPVVDKLLMLRKNNSEDRRIAARIPGENQERVSRKSEVREIPLEYWDIVSEMVEIFRNKKG